NLIRKYRFHRPRPGQIHAGCAMTGISRRLMGLTLGGLRGRTPTYATGFQVTRAQVTLKPVPDTLTETAQQHRQRQRQQAAGGNHLQQLVIHHAQGSVSERVMRCGVKPVNPTDCDRLSMTRSSASRKVSGNSVASIKALRGK